jgi:hypothetical protein
MDYESQVPYDSYAVADNAFARMDTVDPDAIVDPLDAYPLEEIAEDIFFVAGFIPVVRRLTGIRINANEAAASALSLEQAKNALDILRKNDELDGLIRGYEAYQALYLPNGAKFTRLINHPLLMRWRNEDIILATEDSPLVTELGFAVGQEVKLHDIINKIFALE